MYRLVINVLGIGPLHCWSSSVGSKLASLTLSSFRFLSRVAAEKNSIWKMASQATWKLWDAASFINPPTLATQFSPEELSGVFWASSYIFFCGCEICQQNRPRKNNSSWRWCCFLSPLRARTKSNSFPCRWYPKVETEGPWSTRHIASMEWSHLYCDSLEVPCRAVCDTVAAIVDENGMTLLLSGRW